MYMMADGAPAAYSMRARGAPIMADMQVEEQAEPEQEQAGGEPDDTKQPMLQIDEEHIEDFMTNVTKNTRFYSHPNMPT